MVGYKIREVKLDGDQVEIILEGKPEILGKEIDDGFAVWIPADDYNKMTIEELTNKLKQEVTNRIKFLEQTEKEKQEKESQYRNTADMTTGVIKSIDVNVKS